MDILSTPRLRHGEFQTFTENVLNICTGNPELDSEMQKVLTTLAALKTGMQKDKGTGVDKESVDKQRDILCSGFMSDVRAEQKFPHQDATIIGIIRELMKIITKYGAGIVRLPINEETAAMDNLLEEVNELDLAAIETTGIPRWIPVITAANTEFKTATSEFIETKAEFSETDSATSIVPALVQALEGLFGMLFAHIQLASTPALEKAYSELKQLIDSFD